MIDTGRSRRLLLLHPLSTLHPFRHKHGVSIITDFNGSIGEDEARPTPGPKCLLGDARQKTINTGVAL